MNKEIFIIKATATGKETEGVVYIVLDTKQEDASTFDCAFTSQKNTLLPPVNLSGEDFEKALSQYKQQYVLNSQITIPAREALQMAFSQDKIKQLQETENSEKEISELILNTLKDITKDDIQTTVEIEFTSRKEKIESAIEEEEEKKDTDKEIEIYLKSQLAIDPVGGKTIFELCKGDKVLVKIVDDRPIAEYLSSLLSSTSNTGSSPSHICASAYRAEELEENKYRLIVKFGPGVYGETIILPSIKIKTLKEEELTEEKKTKSQQNVQINITPLMFTQALLFILLIALIVFARIIK